MPLRRKMMPELQPTPGIDEKTSRLIKAADSDADSLEGEIGAEDTSVYSDDYEKWMEEEPSTSNHRRFSRNLSTLGTRVDNPKGSSTSLSFDYSTEANTVRRSQRRVELERQRRSKAGGEGNVKMAKETSAPAGMHDRQGRLITPDGRRVQLCDCLDALCAGCHLPCERCESTLCGGECQRARRYFYAEIQINGQPRHSVRHPFFDDS
uniref:ARF7 effector protein C-terminal domain-containing protein n=1 Tax=Plectus sambesii TaxID=2011161 RepID=A0A914V7G9_9BILA